MKFKSFIKLFVSVTLVSCSNETIPDNKKPSISERIELVQQISNEIMLFLDSTETKNWIPIKTPMIHSGKFYNADTIANEFTTDKSLIWIPDSSIFYRLTNESSNIDFNVNKGKVSSLCYATISRPEFSYLIDDICSINNRTYLYLKSNEIINDSLWINKSASINRLNEPNYCFIFKNNKLQKLIYYPVLLN